MNLPYAEPACHPRQPGCARVLWPTGVTNAADCRITLLLSSYWATKSTQVQKGRFSRCRKSSAPHNWHQALPPGRCVRAWSAILTCHAALRLWDRLMPCPAPMDLFVIFSISTVFYISFIPVGYTSFILWTLLIPDGLYPHRTSSTITFTTIFSPNKNCIS